jgi:hypothetical protein
MPRKRRMTLRGLIRLFLGIRRFDVSPTTEWLIDGGPCRAGFGAETAVGTFWRVRAFVA